MARILYGAPETEREEDNGLVAKLRDRHIITYERDKYQVTYTRERHKVEYLNDFLGFAFELSRCENFILLPQKYDLVMYDTRVYGENWLPEIRADHFKFTIIPYLKKSDTPVIVLADEDIKDQIENWVKEHHFHYVAQPCSIDGVVRKVNALLQKPRRKKGQ